MFKKDLYSSFHAPFSRTPKKRQDMFLYQNHQIYLSSYVFTTDELGIETLHLVQKKLGHLQE